MTSEQIEAALKLCAAATPGPWEANDGTSKAPHRFMYDVICPTDDGHRVLAQLNWNFRENLENDRQFIAAARTLLPDALTELRDTRTAMAGLVKQWRERIAELRQAAHDESKSGSVFASQYWVAAEHLAKATDELEAALQDQATS